MLQKREGGDGGPLSAIAGHLRWLLIRARARLEPGEDPQSTGGEGEGLDPSLGLMDTHKELPQTA